MGLLLVVMNGEAFQRALHCHRNGQLDRARTMYLEVIAADPSHAEALHLLGVLEFQQGRAAVGAGLIERAIELRPDNAQYHGNLGLALVADGRPQDAMVSYDAAIAMEPGFAEAHANRGTALGKLGRWEEAAEGFERAVALTGERRQLHAAMLARLGAARTKLGESVPAFDALSRSVDINPDNIEAAGARLFVHNYLPDVSPKRLRSEAEAFGDRLMARVRRPARHDNTVDRDRPLRVGLVSGDFKVHPVARFLTFLGRVDQKSFELFAYYTRGRIDETTARFQRLIPNWRQLDRSSDAEAALIIADDGIDILCDLSGHSSGGRPGIFARKPAPVQFTWLGYFATTGLRTIDYVLCNDIVVPTAEEEQWVERPWRMPDTYLCFGPPPVDVEVGAAPSQLGNVVTFGSFNNFGKLSADTLAAWSELLKAVPLSRLVLRTTPTPSQGRIAEIRHALVGQQGGDRIIFEAPVSNYADHLGGYRAIDIALDPFPYTGGTTTCEALWMGVPVITRRGDRFVAHMGENILNGIGRPDWIACDTADYVRRAAALAADSRALANARSGLRSRFAASPMGDEARFARHFEEALRGMWHDWCDRQSMAGEGAGGL